MAGTPIGRVNCNLITPVADLSSQELFTVTYMFMEQMVGAGYATRIALQYGDTNDPTTGGGSGTGFWDSSASFGENAFMVYRMNGASSGNSESARDGTTLPDFDYYIFFQWADGDAFGTAPGNPGLINGSTTDGLAAVVAVREDGGNPWNGTTANDGSDTKGATVWTAGASTLHVFPVSNNTGGSHATNKENTILINDPGAAPTVASFIGTADSIVVFTSVMTTMQTYIHYYGIYEPRPGLTPSLPLACVSSTLSWNDGTGTTWGDTAGTSSYQGMVLGTLLSDAATPLSVGMGVTGPLGYEVQPNSQYDPPRYDTFPIRVIQRGSGRVGYVGNLETGLMRIVYGAPNGTQSVDGAVAYVGNTTLSDFKFAVAWGGGKPPGVRTGREGDTF